MAAAIELFGDGRSRGGSAASCGVARHSRHVRARARRGRWAWSAVGAATLMALRNLLLVHSRIGTLDVYARCDDDLGRSRCTCGGSRCWPGLVLAVGACFKEVVPYALFVAGADRGGAG